MRQFNFVSAAKDTSKKRKFVFYCKACPAFERENIHLANDSRDFSKSEILSSMMQLSGQTSILDFCQFPPQLTRSLSRIV